MISLEALIVLHPVYGLTIYLCNNKYAFYNSFVRIFTYLLILSRYFFCWILQIYVNSFLLLTWWGVRLYRILDSIVVSIPACHAGDRGSIPRRGDFLLEKFSKYYIFYIIITLNRWWQRISTIIPWYRPIFELNLMLRNLWPKCHYCTCHLYSVYPPSSFNILFCRRKFDHNKSSFSWS